MEARYDKFIASLPEELAEGGSHDAAINTLLANLAGKPVPTSRLARLWAIGSTQMSIAIASLGAWTKGVLSSEEKKIVIKNEAQMRSALKVLSTMGYLRGAMTKLGQTLSAYPNIGSEQMSTILASLNFEAPPMHFSLLREQVCNELGGDPEDVFAEFDEVPFAAASLGQVHRARLKSGEAVAVKIQYPNIARSIRTDLANLKLLMSAMRFSKEWKFMIAVVEDIKETFLIETDYRREAEYAELARKTLEDTDGIVVPKVFSEFSTGRVLTMEFLKGCHLKEFLKRGATQAEKDRAGELMFRAMCRLFYSGPMIHADPNEGNFLMMDDGRLGLLDFGCCRVFTDDEKEYFSAGTFEFLKDGAPSDDLIQKGTLLTAKEMAEEDRLRLLRESVAWLWEPLLVKGAFTFDQAYLKRGLDNMVEVTRKRYTRVTPIHTWTNRMFYGLRLLLCRLNATFEAGRVNMEEVNAGVLGRE